MSAWESRAAVQKSTWEFRARGPAEYMGVLISLEAITIPQHVTIFSTEYV